jgi:hypothetical protein
MLVSTEACLFSQGYAWPDLHVILVLGRRGRIKLQFIVQTNS